MEPTQLTDEQQRALEALSAIEERQGESRADDIAREAGMEPEVTREALSALVTEKDLVRELSADEDRDLGPRYRVKDSVS